MYRFALRPKWIAMHVVVLAVVAMFAVAGFWQVSRLRERRAENALVEQRRAMPVLAHVGEAHRRVRLEGRYDRSNEVLLRGRGSGGRPGNHVLTPLRVDGTTVIVDRGYIPIDAPSRAYRAPTARVRIEGLLLPSEGAAPFGGGEGKVESISRIDLARLGDQLPYRIEPVYVLLAKQRPPEVDLPEPVEEAELHEGSHQIYAVQWFSFIPIALIVYAAILRRERKKLATPPAAVG